MHRFLERVGVSEQVLALIPEICKTCKVCRDWAKPGPDNACSVDIVDLFNKQVECDLLFIRTYIIFHMIDRCIRWHEAQLIQDREDRTLLTAIDDLWVKGTEPQQSLSPTRSRG